MARATTGTWVITSDTTLTEDHHGSIVIAADGVSLDCAGFSVIGPDQPDGILVDGYDHVTVKDCRVVGFEGHGVNIPASTAPELGNNLAEFNGRSGYYLGFVAEGVLEDNIARDNTGHGIEFEGGPSWGHLVEGNISVGNFNGFYITAVSDSAFAENVASDNEYRGFALDQDVGPGNTFERNEVTGNGDSGFSVDESNDNRFVANTIGGNGGSGILLGGSGHIVSGNDASDNSYAGVELAEARDNLIAQNAISANGWGILVHSDSDRNVIRKNDVGWHDAIGIVINDGSEWNLVEGNTSSNNDSTGFRISSSHNVVLANRAMHNGEYGFRVSGGRANKLVVNSACNNGILDAFQDPGVRGNAWIKNRFCTSNT